MKTKHKKYFHAPSYPPPRIWLWPLYLHDMRIMMKDQNSKIRKNHKTELLKYPQEAQIIDEVYFRRLEDKQ